MRFGVCTRLLGVLVMLVILSGCIQKQTTYRIGVVVGTESFGAFSDSFIDYMQVLGYNENENIRYDVHVGDLSRQEVSEIAARFVKDNVDLIVTAPTGVTTTVQDAARNSAIPIVFGIAHTEGTGIIKSISRPGNNITGVRFPAKDLIVRRFEYLLELVPDARTIMIPYGPAYPGASAYIELLEDLAIQQGKTLVPVAMHSKNDFDVFIQTYPNEEREPVDAILQLPDPVGRSEDYFETYGRYAMNKDIVVGGDYVESGDITSTFGIQVDINSAAMQVAFLTDKVLQGANAGSLSVLDPDPELTVNLKELQRLGIDAPYEMLYKADYVIR